MENKRSKQSYFAIQKDENCEKIFGNGYRKMKTC